MDEEVENQSAVQEIATPETQNHEEVSQETKVEVQKPVDDRQERNFKAMREKQKELERELKLQKEMNERFLQMTAPQPSKVVEIDDLDSVSDEEFIPKGKSRKLVRKEVEPLRTEIDELKKQLNTQKQRQFMDDLRRQYSDFDEIVNVDTLALLEEQEPELAQTIVDTKDPYKVCIQSYKYIKALNLLNKVPEARHSREVDKKIEKNAKTVQTPQAYDKRPMAQAYVLTDSEKSKLYEEMTRCGRMAGSVPELN